MTTTLINAPDTSQATIMERPADSRGELPCWILRPPHTDPEQPPMVVIHGILRNPRRMLGELRERAACLGRTLIAPCFEKPDWRGYQQAIIRGRADLALLTLLERLSLEGIIPSGPCEFFGYSGGAQFAHRFALLHPQRVSRLVLLSAGWYTFPDEQPYPYGLAKPRKPLSVWGPHVHASFHRFLQLPIRVAVGTEDTERDLHTRTGPRIDRQQGPHRLARGENWVNALTEAACQRGISADIQFTELPQCGHDFRNCYRRSTFHRILFPEPEPRNVPHPEPLTSRPGSEKNQNSEGAGGHFIHR